MAFGPTAGFDESDPVQAGRVARLLAAVLDVGMGTVWKVREDLWKALLPEYDQESDRGWHPGLSLRVEPPEGLYEVVPMLNGTSGDTGPVVARGLSRECGPEHPTSFGKLVRPGRMAVREFIEPDPDADPEECAGPWHRRHRVAVNWWKPRLDAAEQATLESWARNRGLL